MTYRILRLDGDGHPELYAETRLMGEVERFEELGFLVEPVDGEVCP